VDWYSAKPFEIVQIDLKFIRDRKALTKEQIIHLDRCGIPNYQWSALDVNSRFKLMAYSRDKSWTNGLCWYLYVISWLRSHGVQAQIVFTVDHGQLFGAQSWIKVAELRKLVCSPGQSPRSTGTMEWEQCVGTAPSGLRLGHGVSSARQHPARPRERWEICLLRKNPH